MESQRTTLVSCTAWQRINILPSSPLNNSRASGYRACVWDGKKALIYGGKTDSSKFKGLSYDPEKTEWAYLENGPDLESDQIVTSAYSKGRFYLFGHDERWLVLDVAKKRGAV